MQRGAQSSSHTDVRTSDLHLVVTDSTDSTDSTSSGQASIVAHARSSTHESPCHSCRTDGRVAAVTALLYSCRTDGPLSMTALSR